MTTRHSSSRSFLSLSVAFVQTSLTVALGLPAAASAAPAAGAAPTAAVVVVKKPSNLVAAGGPTSFISEAKPEAKAAAKPVVPALERARLVRAYIVVEVLLCSHILWSAARCAGS
jgi:hypothetical protein